MAVWIVLQCSMRPVRHILQLTTDTYKCWLMKRFLGQTVWLLISTCLFSDPSRRAHWETVRTSRSGRGISPRRCWCPKSATRSAVSPRYHPVWNTWPGHSPSSCYQTVCCCHLLERIDTLVPWIFCWSSLASTFTHCISLAVLAFESCSPSRIQGLTIQVFPNVLICYIFPSFQIKVAGISVMKVRISSPSKNSDSIQKLEDENNTRW